MSEPFRVNVGYCNENMDCALISVSNALLSNPWPKGGQFIISIEAAAELRAALDAFIAQHGVTFN